MVMQRSYLRCPARSCIPIEYDEAAGETRRYLLSDLYLRCNTDEYQETKTIAIAMIVVWPCGWAVVATMFLLHAMLIVPILILAAFIGSTFLCCG